MINYVYHKNIKKQKGGLGKLDEATTNVSKYVKETGINVSKMSECTGIPYFQLYYSLLNKKRNRPLRASEYLKVCKFLQKSPWDFK